MTQPTQQITPSPQATKCKYCRTTIVAEKHGDTCNSCTVLTEHAEKFFTTRPGIKFMTDLMGDIAQKCKNVRMIDNEETDCYNCKHSGPVPGNAHIRCNQDWSIFIAPKADQHGIDNGWVLFPFCFDPTWLYSCTGFEKKD